MRVQEQSPVTGILEVIKSINEEQNAFNIPAGSRDVGSHAAMVAAPPIPETAQIVADGCGSTEPRDINKKVQDELKHTRSGPQRNVMMLPIANAPMSLGRWL